MKTIFKNIPLAATIGLILASISSPNAVADPASDCETLQQSAHDGDLVFLEVDHLPFSEVAESSKSWTSHVGILFRDPEGLFVYESTFPSSKKTEACAFLTHSTNGRFALTRLSAGLSEQQLQVIKDKATSMFGIFYHTGFDLDSTSRTFCSKYVYDAYAAAGIQVGQPETFRQLLDAFEDGPQKEALIGFWKRWFWAGFRYSGVPWDRRTITPASELLDPSFDLILGKREI